MRIHFSSPIVRMMSVGATIAVAMLAISPVHAVVVSLTPTDVHGDDSATAQFSDSFLTLTPFQGAIGSLTQATFNAQPARLGIDDFGTNANAFNDADTDPNNGNEERLQFEFTGGAALTQITYDFARADGPGDDDGVIISGFVSDPQVSFSVSDANLFSVFDDVAGSVRLNIPGELFNGNLVEVNFANPLASQDQTLLLSVTDTTQAGAQFPIRGISYDDSPAIPGDVDGMNGVTIDDFIIIRDNFFDMVATREEGDLNLDGIVDIDDFDQWKDNFPGDTAAFASQLFSSTPEPASLMLLAFGGLFLSARQRVVR